MEREFHKIRRLPPYVFAEHGEGYVRIGLCENTHRTRQAVRPIKALLGADKKAAAQ